MMQGKLPYDIIIHLIAEELGELSNDDSVQSNELVDSRSYDELGFEPELESVEESSQQENMPDEPFYIP